MLTKHSNGICQNVVVCFHHLFYNEENPNHDDDDPDPAGERHGFVEDELCGYQPDDVADGQ